MSKKIENQTWYVVFCDSEEIRAPFKWFTCEGFRHVFCVAESPSGSLIQNYTDHHCEVRISYGKKATDLAFEFVEAGCQVLKVVTDKKPGYCFRGLVYCVTLTKAFLGLRGCYAATPRGLHTWLKNSNLSVIDLNQVAEKVMVGSAPKTQGVDPELKKQQQQELERAEREEERLRQERIAGGDRLRRKQTGIFSLLKTEGGELGAPKSLLSGTK